MKKNILLSKFCSPFLIFLCLSVSCDDSSTTADSQLAAPLQCRINSDCSFSQRCLEGICEESDDPPMMPEVCIDDDCACSTDLQCPASYYCDRQAQVCSPIECQVSRECDLGRICIQHLCVTDINADRDRDGVPDAEDSCPLQANPDQEDHDRDLIGDLCDPDDDNDQVPDYIDNCVFTYNPLQGNADADAEESSETELLGNACDSDTPGISIRGQLDLSLLPGADPTAARVYIGDRIEPIVVNPDGSFTAEVAATEPGRLKIQIRWLGLAALEDEITLPRSSRALSDRDSLPARAAQRVKSRVKGKD